MTPTPYTQEHILVIKHGALGDMILATGPFQAIRNRHPNAHITLLTTKPFVKLMSEAPYFNEIWVDTRPLWYKLHEWISIAKMLRKYRFSWVYDLQTSERTGRYFHFFPRPKPSFSGIAKGASHRHNTPHRITSHTIDRQREQLAIAGITDVPPPNIDWMKGDISAITPPTPFALLVPGGSAHRPEKRWPQEKYIELANTLLGKGFTPVWIGAGAEETLLNELAASTPGSLNYCNKTSYGQLVQLAKKAAFAVGNDTGPMHIIAAAGCRSAVLFNTHASNPALCAPRGEHVSIIAVEDLNTLGISEVLASST